MEPTSKGPCRFSDFWIDIQDMNIDIQDMNIDIQDMNIDTYWHRQKRSEFLSQICEPCKKQMFSMSLRDYIWSETI